MTRNIPTMTRMTQGSPPCGTAVAFLPFTGLNFPINSMVSSRPFEACKNRSR